MKAMTLPRHAYEESRITPGRCGAPEYLSPGHIRNCGLPESHLAHDLSPGRCKICNFVLNWSGECANCEDLAKEQARDAEIAEYEHEEYRIRQKGKTLNGKSQTQTVR